MGVAVAVEDTARQEGSVLEDRDGSNTAWIGRCLPGIEGEVERAIGIKTSDVSTGDAVDVRKGTADEKFAVSLDSETLESHRIFRLESGRRKSVVVGPIGVHPAQGRCGVTGMVRDVELVAPTGNRTRHLTRYICKRSEEH